MWFLGFPHSWLVRIVPDSCEKTFSKPHIPVRFRPSDIRLSLFLMSTYNTYIPSTGTLTPLAPVPFVRPTCISMMFRSSAAVSSVTASMAPLVSRPPLAEWPLEGVSAGAGSAEPSVEPVPAAAAAAAGLPIFTQFSWRRDKPRMEQTSANKLRLVGENAVEVRAGSRALKNAHAVGKRVRFFMLSRLSVRLTLWTWLRRWAEDHATFTPLSFNIVRSFCWSMTNIRSNPAHWGGKGGRGHWQIGFGQWWISARFPSSADGGNSTILLVSSDNLKWPLKPFKLQVKLFVVDSWILKYQ